MPTMHELERDIGFPPNSGLDDHKRNITTSAMAIALVRSWVQSQGIPYKAARSALPESLAAAYTNNRYLNSWRKRLNPNWDLTRR